MRPSCKPCSKIRIRISSQLSLGFSKEDQKLQEEAFQDEGGLWWK